MIESERIERQYQDAKDLYAYLMDHDEVTFASYIDSTYKKVLLLSAASFFEHSIITIIKDYASKISSSDVRLVNFIERKALSRQYHTLFDWDANNTNKFWRLFGEATIEQVRANISLNTNLKRAEISFLELGKHRNMLVHENYAEYDVNLTVDEIYCKYKFACDFIEYVRSVLIEKNADGDKPCCDTDLIPAAPETW